MNTDGRYWARTSDLLLVSWPRRPLSVATARHGVQWSGLRPRGGRVDPPLFAPFAFQARSKRPVTSARRAREDASRLVAWHAMEYDNVISDVVRVVEAVGAGVMVVGGFGAFVIFIARAAQPERRAGSYKDLRRNLGRSILLGVEVLIIADIVRTIIVDPTFESVLVLAVIVMIRIVLSFSLEVEMDGVLPWNRLPRERPKAVDAPTD